MWGNHSQPGHTSFHEPTPPPRISPPSTHTPRRLKRAKGSGTFWRQPRPSREADPFVFVFDGEFRGQSASTPPVPVPPSPHEVSMTSVFQHGRFAGRGVTCGARQSLGPCACSVQVACTFHRSLLFSRSVLRIALKHNPGVKLGKIRSY